MAPELPTEPDQPLEGAFQPDKELAEKLTKASRHAAQWTSLGVLVVLISLFWSFLSIRSATKQLDDINQEVGRRKAEKAQLEQDIAQLTSEKNALFVLSNGLLNQPGQTGSQTLKAVVEANPEIANVIPRVYLHIGSQAQRGDANRIAELLRASGFTVPGTEYVGAAKSPGVTQVRYFYPLRESAADVDKLAKTLKSAGIESRPQLIKLPEGTRTPHPRQYEVWFSLFQFDKERLLEVR